MKRYDPLLPAESIKFQNILNQFCKKFEKYGFIPHLTSVFCDLDAMQEATDSENLFSVSDPENNLKDVGLRYDHTVPLEQYIKNNHDKLAYPFKRYTAQPVYRPKDDCQLNEFYACDVDIIGKNGLSLTYDAEILCVIYEALKSLQLENNSQKSTAGFYIALNNRKLLNGILDHLNVHDDNERRSVRNAIGAHNSAVLQDELDQKQYTVIADFITTFEELDKSKEHDAQEVINTLRSFAFGEEFFSAIDDIESIYRNSLKLGIPEGIVRICPTATRSMTIYTGTTISTFLTEGDEKESICHGGRYRFSTEDGKEELIGIGVTFPLTFLFNKLINRIPDEFSTIAPVMVSGTGSVEHAMYIATRLREKSIATELFLEENMSIEEQITYARQRGFHLFLWTEKNLDRPLKSDDIVKKLNLKEPGRAQSYKCSGLFTGIEISLAAKKRISAAY